MQWIQNNWLAVLLFFVLILVYGLTAEEAQIFVSQLIEWWKGL